MPERIISSTTGFAKEHWYPLTVTGFTGSLAAGFILENPILLTIGFLVLSGLGIGLVTGKIKDEGSFPWDNFRKKH